MSPATTFRPHHCAATAYRNDWMIRTVLEQCPEWLPEKVWPRLDDDPLTGCRVWLGALGGGYGCVSLPRAATGRQVGVRVHRVALIAAGSTIPFGMVVDHLCRVKACANPAHLEVVTPDVNNARSVHRSSGDQRILNAAVRALGLTHRQYGDTHGWSVETARQVLKGATE